MSKLQNLKKHFEPLVEFDNDVIDFEETAVTVNDVVFVAAEPVATTVPWLPAVDDIVVGYCIWADLNTMYGVRTQMTINTADKRLTVWVNGAFKRVLRDISAVNGDFLAIKCVRTDQWNGNTVRYYAVAKITPTF
jgi:hypothetical protein